MSRGINDLANGLGLIYMTENDGVTIRNVIQNDIRGARWMREAGSVNAPIWANKSAVATIAVTSCASAGNITAITIAGNNQIGSNIAVATSNILVLAAQIATAINAFTPGAGFDYTAVAISNTVYVFAPDTAGTAPNGQAITVSVSDVTIVTTTTNFVNGSTNQGDDDATIGYRFFLDADYGATGVSGSTPANPSVLTYVLEITKYITVRGMEGSIDIQNKAISLINSEYVMQAVTRRSNHTLIISDGRSGGAGYLYTIDPSQFIDGDEVILTLKAGGNQYIITDATVNGVGNIYLSNQQPFGMSTVYQYITLVMRVSAGNGAAFYEKNRTGDQQLVPDVDNMRAQDVAISVQGVQVTTLTTGGGTVNLGAGIDKGYQVFNGTGTLLASWNIQPDPGVTPLDGDEFWCRYDGTMTSNGNNITFFNSTLTQDQVSAGGVLVYSKYSLGDTTWYTTVFIDEELQGLGQDEAITVPGSFETGEQCNNTAFVPYAFSPGIAYATVTKDMENSDDGTIDFSINGGGSLGTLTIPASAIQNSTYSIDLTSTTVYSASVNAFYSATFKTTSGGKVLITLTVKRRL